jgi:hypothetical protein
MNVVLVPGFLSPRSTLLNYWGTAFDVSTTALVVAVSPSGVASLHDRCCEIFAELTGTQVNYGTAHAKEHHHHQYGRSYTRPLLPNWSAENPIHFVGHSYGGPTARYFQHLCTIGFFGPQFNAHCVQSITTINAPHNGAMAVYALGQQHDTCTHLEQQPQPVATRSKHVATLSIGWCLGMYVHVHQYLSNHCSLINGVFDFGMAHWPSTSSFSRTCAAVFKKSDMFEQRDSANHDMSVHAAHAINANMATDPSTYYISVVGSALAASNNTNTDTADDHDVKAPHGVCSNVDDDRTSWGETILCVCGSIFMVLLKLFTLWNYASIQKSVTETTIKEWQDTGSDGLVTVKSQMFPLVDATGNTPNHSVVNSLQEMRALIRPGCWFVHHVHEHHLGIVPFPKSKMAQRHFFSTLFTLLETLPNNTKKLPTHFDRQRQ